MTDTARHPTDENMAPDSTPNDAPETVTEPERIPSAFGSGKTAAIPDRDAALQQAKLAARRYRLRPPSRRNRGGDGKTLGNESGSSLDFHDFRSYQPGDDLRRVDWNVFARSDALMIRQYRVELAPSLDIILDSSVSLSATPGKELFCLMLTEFLMELCRRSGGRSTLILGKSRYPLRQAASLLSGLRLETQGYGGGLFPPAWAEGGRRSSRVIVSDFLFPQDPEELVRTAARNTDQLFLIQVLADEERNPDLRGSMRLVNLVDAHEKRDVRLHPAAIERYREKLARHTALLADAARRTRATLIELTAPALTTPVLADGTRDGWGDFAAVCSALLRHGLTEPA